MDKQRPQTYKQRQGLLSYNRGLFAENLCRFVLFVKGYRLVAHRYKTAVGEIDLIAKKGQTLAFIEVKARKDIETASTALCPKQIKRLERASAIFLANHARYMTFDHRFDLMLVAKGRWPQHILQAW